MSFMYDLILFSLGAGFGWNLCRVYDEVRKNKSREAARRNRMEGLDYTFPSFDALWSFYEEANQIVGMHGRVYISYLDDLSDEPDKYADTGWSWTRLKMVTILKDKNGIYHLIIPKFELVPLE